MKIIILTIALLIVSIGTFSQNEADERAFSYGLAKTYYSDKDYINAYKYFLIYKYSHFELLQSAKNQFFLTALNDAIKFCETRIQIAVSKEGSWQGKGWNESEVESFVKVKNDPPPAIPETHP